MLWHSVAQVHKWLSWFIGKKIDHYQFLLWYGQKSSLELDQGQNMAKAQVQYYILDPLIWVQVINHALNSLKVMSQRRTCSDWASTAEIDFFRRCPIRGWVYYYGYSDTVCFSGASFANSCWQATHILMADQVRHVSNWVLLQWIYIYLWPERDFNIINYEPG